jgi:cation diffusion facilitator family transporter
MGVVDPEILSMDRGFYAVKWSFAGLMIASLFQVLVFSISGSTVLLTDTIHNLGNAATAIPLSFAFILSREKPNKRFTYGYVRVEDLAGVLIIFLIIFSTAVAVYESICRLFSPKPIEFLWAVSAASVIGFMGNELVAKFRIKWERKSEVLLLLLMVIMLEQMVFLALPCFSGLLVSG